MDPGIQKVLDGMNALALEGPPAHEIPIEQARAGHEQETEQLSGPGEDVAEVRDVQVPGASGPIPVRIYRPLEPSGGVVAYFHGGGWAVGSIESFDTVCRALANASGAVVGSVGYRLAPEHPFPAALEDCVAATKGLADLHPGEPLAVAGDSAGGNLALGVARRLRDQIKAQALIYPVCDAGLNTPSYRDFKERYGLTAAGMQRYWNLYLDGADGFQPDASPLRAEDLAGLPPTFVLTAEFDVLRDEGEALAGKLREAGVDVTHRRYDGTIHGFWRWMAATEMTRRAVTETGARSGARWAEPMLRRIQGDGVTLTVQDEGEGAPVLLIHGFPDSHHLWRHQVPALVGAGKRVIAPDLRGFGDSDKPQEVAAYGVRHSVADLLAVLDALEIERAQVVGADWGAAVAWALAAFVPERVERLVVLSVGHPHTFAEPTIEQREKSWYMLLFQFADVAEEMLQRDDWRLLHEWLRGNGDVERYLEDLSRPGALTAALNWYRANVAPRVREGSAFPAVTVPTLGIWSSGDDYLTEAQIARSGEAVEAEWRYERIEGASHWMQLDEPDRLNELLLGFLA